MLRRSRSVAAAVAMLAAGACARRAAAPAPDRGAASNVPPPRADGRLPRQVRPTRYALDFIVDPAKERFSGRARIAVAVAEPTAAIVMNARGLTVKAAAIETAG